MGNLSDRLTFAEAWRHEPNDQLIGLVVDRGSCPSEYGDGPYEVLTIQVDEPSTETGGAEIPLGQERAFHTFRTVPRNEVRHKDPRIGDRLAVRYFGKPEGKEYEAYKIVVEHQRETAEASESAERRAAEQEDAEARDAQADEDPDADDIPF